MGPHRRGRGQRLRGPLRRQPRQAGHPPLAEGCAVPGRRAAAGHRRRPRGRGDRLAPAAGAQAQGPGPPDGVPRDHPGRHRRGGGQPARPGLRSGRRAGDPAHPGPPLRLRGLAGAVEEGDAAAVGRPGAVRRHPPGGGPGARAHRLPLRLVLGPGRGPRRRRRGRAAAVPGPADPGRGAPGGSGPRLRQLAAPWSAGGSEQLLRLDQAAGREPGRCAAERRFRGHLHRVQALHAPPVRAVPDHDAAAGGRPQARLHRAADDVGGPGPVRGGLHHLHADRLGHPVRLRDHRRPQPGSAAVRSRSTCPTGRASTPARSRTPRRRTRRSGRRGRPSSPRPRPG